MITTLTGSNNFLLQQELQRLIGDFVAKYTDFGLEKYDGEELEVDVLLSGVSALPFLAERRMVVVRDGWANKDLAEQIEKIINNVADTTDLIIVEPHPDKRSSYYKTLKKLTDFREFNSLERASLPKWLSQEAKNNGGELSFSDANYLVERVGDNQMQLSNELDKLLSYSPQISREGIDLLTEKAPQSTIFELLDAAFHRYR